MEIQLLRKHQDVDSDTLAKLAALIQPVTMDSTKPEDYDRLCETLDTIDQASGVTHQRLFYLAIPPDIFPHVISCLKASGLSDESQGSARRILVEKPFGTNLQTAHELVDTMAQAFEENQMYRIDHYLAKENAQNMLTFRFSNPLIEGIWSRQFIDHIQITAFESSGIDSRSTFYESTGALRDLMQSHLLQLLALITLEQPHAMNSQELHKERLALLNAIQPIKLNHVEELSVRGQYEGYRDEVDNQNSNTETFAAICLEIANSRWGGVPILLRTGKGMDKHITEIKVVFKDRTNNNLPDNVLTIRIQPNEGISISLTAKRPGFDNVLQPVDMQFTYQDSFEGDSPDAYERVLVDAIAGDQSLFASSDEVLRCWEILEPILDAWNSSNTQPTVYQKGSSGPTGADSLAASFGCEWL